LEFLPYQNQKRHHSHHHHHHPPHFAESLSKLSALILSSHMRLHNQSSPIILGLGNDDSAFVAQLDLTIERFSLITVIETVFLSSPLTSERVMSLLFFALMLTQSPFSFFHLLLVKLCLCRQPAHRLASGTRSSLNPKPRTTGGYEDVEPPLSVSRVFLCVFRHVRYSCAARNGIQEPTDSAVP